jgi:hypothetical protein
VGTYYELLEKAGKSLHPPKYKRYIDFVAELFKPENSE